MPYRAMLSLSLAVALSLSVSGGAEAQRDDVTVVTDARFCELLTSDVRACEEALVELANAKLAPETIAGLFIPQGVPSDEAARPDPVAWADFAAHASAFMGLMEAPLREAGDLMASNAPMADWAEPLARLEADFAAEVEWLDAREPSRCFEEYYQDYREVVAAFRDLMATLHRAVEDRDADALVEAVASGASMSARLQQVLGSAGLAGEACAADG